MPKAINGRFCDEWTYQLPFDEVDRVLPGTPTGHLDLAVEHVGPPTEVGVAKTQDGVLDTRPKVY
jgi:hypothetical protein